MIRPDLFWKLVRFGVVGIAVMFFFMALNWLLSRWCGEQLAFLLAYPPALGLHFLLNKWWTFGCQRTDAVRQVSEYLVMALITFGIQWLVFTGVITWTSLPSWAAAGVANVAQMLVTFLIMNRKVFASGASPT